MRVRTLLVLALLTPLALLGLSLSLAQTPSQVVRASPPQAVVQEATLDAQAALDASSEATGQIAAPVAVPESVVVDPKTGATEVVINPSTKISDFWASQAGLVPLILIVVALLKRHIPFVNTNPLYPLAASFLSGIGLALLGRLIGYLALDLEGAVMFGVGGAVIASGGRSGLINLLAKVFDLRELAKIASGTVPAAEPLQPVQTVPNGSVQNPTPPRGNADESGNTAGGLIPPNFGR